MKRIIFDVDNTLLKSTRDILDTYKEFLKDKNISHINDHDFWDAMAEYEKLNDFTDKEKIVEFLNNYLKINISVDDYNELIYIYGTKSSLIHKDTAKILEELSKKYEMVILSNWYSYNQKDRLERVGILKYFKDVYGIDNLGSKPDIKTYIDASYPHDIKDCIIVGDSLTFDIEVPHKIGMRAIYFNPDNNDVEYESITSLDELLDIL